MKVSDNLILEILKLFPDIYEMMAFIAKLCTGEESANENDWEFIAKLAKYEKYGIMDFFEKVKGGNA